MSQINELTKVQAIQLQKHRDEYLGYGLSCEHVDKKLAEESIRNIYSWHLNKRLNYFWVCDSPLMCNLIISILKNNGFKESNLRSNLRSNLESNMISNLISNLRSNLGSNLRSNLRSNLGSNLESNLRSNLESNLRSNLESNLRGNLISNLWSNLRSNLVSNLRGNLISNLESNLWSNLESNLRGNLISNLRSNLESNLVSNLRSNLVSNLRGNLISNLRGNLESNLYQYCNFWGQIDMYWVAYYQYPSKYLNVNYGELQKVLDFWDGVGRSCAWWYPFENIVFVSDRPKIIYKNEEGQLHKDREPAISFRDGYCLWMLNGVECPRDVVETPGEEINCKLLVEEKNAQVRAEIIKKVGYSKILRDLKAKHLDSWREYELYRIDNLDVEPICLVKFNCPSTGTYYSLRVPPQINTAKEAIKWCNQDVSPDEFLVET